MKDNDTVNEEFLENIKLENVHTNKEPELYSANSTSNECMNYKPRSIFTIPCSSRDVFNDTENESPINLSSKNKLLSHGDNINVKYEYEKYNQLEKQDVVRNFPGTVLAKAHANNFENKPVIIENINDQEAGKLVGVYEVSSQDGSLTKIYELTSLLKIGDNVAVLNEPTIQGQNYVIQLNMSNAFNKFLRTDNSVNCDQDGFLNDNSSLPGKRKYKKRKHRKIDDDDDDYVPPIRLRNIAGIPKPMADKVEEVLKAAKSLFSKRTRTLYHWMYPTTSKQELKNVVDFSWDTLPDAEKHFYVSQVLGRFGFPASNLMVNPQIGGMTSSPVQQLRKITACTSTINTNMKKTVEELLANEREDDNWMCRQNPDTWKLLRNYKVSEDNQMAFRPMEFGLLTDDGQNLESLDNIDDTLFVDDPELAQEYAKYKENITYDNSEIIL